MNNADKAFGTLLKAKRGAFGLSQAALARALRWPQTKVSRVEQGKRSVTLPELLSLARVFKRSVDQLLAEIEGGVGKTAVHPLDASAFSAGFHAAYASEEESLSQLARYGVRFLGGPARPAFFALPFDEVLLTGLRFSQDPRVFEALPALLLKNAARVDWSKLTAAAYSLRLQNRLGMVVAASLAMKGVADVHESVWVRFEQVHGLLAEAKLDREEVVGPAPKTDAARVFLRRRTPDWLRFWHGVGSGDLESFRRHLNR